MTNAEDRAFPNRLTSGLTKREYFAAMAMQGLLSREGWAERFASEENGDAVKMFATASVNSADALIKELNNEKKDK